VTCVIFYARIRLCKKVTRFLTALSIAEKMMWNCQNRWTKTSRSLEIVSRFVDLHAGRWAQLNPQSMRRLLANSSAPVHCGFAPIRNGFDVPWPVRILSVNSLDLLLFDFLSRACAVALRRVIKTNRTQERLSSEIVGLYYPSCRERPILPVMQSAADITRHLESGLYSPHAESGLYYFNAFVIIQILTP